MQAAKEQGFEQLRNKLAEIIPDISKQRSHSMTEGQYAQTKMRMQHAFQMKVFERAVRLLAKKKLTIVDIGDSFGTHLQYIKALCNDLDIQTISVDIDKKAVEKIRAKGMKAIHCAAEDLDLGETGIDLFATFQMIEHLTNPCLFFRRMAQKGKCDMMVVTVPYLKQSRLGMYCVRRYLHAINDYDTNDVDIFKEIYPEQEHIFELSPEDWKLLMLFCGWKPVYEEVYLQYPKKHLLGLSKIYWKKYDFEGFWGVILKRDRFISDRYLGWQE
jgi:2-polyprenyl-3-methyl-5-hydroxy-6-metoxy-1,4-benzoquinol methylase